jgi:hypothetical protein
MNNRTHLLSLTQQILPTGVRDYAKFRKWEPVTGIKSRLWVFKEQGSLRQLLIPMDQEDDDYSEAILEVVQRIAENEKRNVISVISDLLTPNSDIIRFKISNDDSISGTRSLDDGVNLLDGAKKALLASASSVINPTTHHLRMSRTEAEDFIKACRLGQTEYGSFVAKISCPLNAVIGNDSLFDYNDPFTRKSTSLLLRACNALVDGIENDCIENILETNNAKPEISSNLCDALIKMQSIRERSTLTIDVTWASNSHVKLPENIPSKVMFKAEYFNKIETIHQSLRPTKENQERQSFIGTVETLNGNIGEDGKRSGEVVLALFLPDEEIVKARAELSVEDYRKAITAHDKGLGYITFRGTLHRGIRIGKIDNVIDFNILN